MRTLAFACLAICPFLACSSREPEATGQQKQLLSGLVASYSFDAGSGTTAADSSGNGNTATLNGPTWTSAGKYGQALSFDGVKARLDIADSNSLDLTSAWTISAWIKPTTASGWRTVLLKEYNSPLGLAYALYASGDSAHPWVGYSTSSATRSTEGGSTTVNVWQHVAATFDGTTLRLYKDGAQISSANVPGQAVASTGALRIGGNATWGEYFSGLIDEVQIYSRALSATEIVTVRDTPLGGGGGGGGSGGNGGAAGAAGSGGNSAGSAAGGSASGGASAGSSGSSGSAGTSGSGGTANITVNGATTYQTIDGFGFSVNAHSWDNGAVKPALDALDTAGTKIWRVVYEMTDWESTNDDNDPSNFNWTSYNAIFSSAAFEELWSTIAYLNSKGHTTNVMLDFMGRLPSWMGGSALNTALRDEFVETVVAAAYYGRITRGLQFGMLAPTNETDWDGIEGPQISASDYADVMNRIAVRLDAIPGLSSLKLVGPDTAQVQQGVGDYMPAMTQRPTLMAHVNAFAIHQYAPSTGGLMAAIQASTYPDRHGWVSETSSILDAWAQLQENASGIIVWDGYDSVYNHAILAGRGSTAPNDAGPQPAPLAYANGTYSKRAEYYQWQQLFASVAPGAQRIDASSSASGISALAFKHPTSGQLSIVGRNDTSAGQTLTLALSNLGTLPSSLSFWVTNQSQSYAKQADVTVANGRATITVPNNCFFTLTSAASSGTPDTTPPVVNLQTLTLSVSASDAVGVAGVQFLIDGQNLGAEQTSAPFSAAWTTTSGSHTLGVRARDAAGNSTLKTLSVTVP